MPKQQMYRVVETSIVGSERVERDIGSEWKAERAAKDELRKLKQQNNTRWLSLQKSQ
ncbi:hypothetical protein ABH908_000093 [Pseudomonas frederiksbergensis]|uniref:hypothetical protein n=1 Tax=Pseudomonas TaxID=286 RepID=UPI003D1F4563